jgi:hypothetical protein
METDDLEGEGLSLEVGLIPNVTGRLICLRGLAYFLGTIPWKGAPVGQIGNQLMPMASSV